jgi:hypothetical protein
VRHSIAEGVKPFSCTPACIVYCMGDSPYKTKQTGEYENGFSAHGQRSKTWPCYHYAARRSALYGAESRRVRIDGLS